jgi:hypothetical protein
VRLVSGSGSGAIRARLEGLALLETRTLFGPAGARRKCGTIEARFAAASSGWAITERTLTACSRRGTREAPAIPGAIRRRPGEAFAPVHGRFAESLTRGSIRGWPGETTAVASGGRPAKASAGVAAPGRIAALATILTSIVAAWCKAAGLAGATVRAASAFFGAGAFQAATRRRPERLSRAALVRVQIDGPTGLLGQHSRGFDPLRLPFSVSGKAKHA